MHTPYAHLSQGKTASHERFATKKKKLKKSVPLVNGPHGCRAGTISLRAQRKTLLRWDIVYSVLLYISNRVRQKRLIKRRVIPPFISVLGCIDFSFYITLFHFPSSAISGIGFDKRRVFLHISKPSEAAARPTSSWFEVETKVRATPPKARVESDPFFLLFSSPSRILSLLHCSLRVRHG